MKKESIKSLGSIGNRGRYTGGNYGIIILCTLQNLIYDLTIQHLQPIIQCSIQYKIQSTHVSHSSYTIT